MGERIVILVPWRGGDARREWCWDITRPALEDFGWPIYTGDGDGPWARAAACNAAAAAAGDWDLALIADCDTIPEPASIMRALDWVRSTGGGCRPHDERWMLTKEGSLVFAQDGGPERLERHHVGKLFPGGGLLVLTRDAWDAVGGYDEAFIGWGYEDSAMTLALMRERRWDRIPGDAWHLWHPGTENKPRRESLARYKKLLKDNAGMIRDWARTKGLSRPQEVL